MNSVTELVDLYKTELVKGDYETGFDKLNLTIRFEEGFFFKLMHYPLLPGEGK